MNDAEGRLARFFDRCVDEGMMLEFDEQEAVRLDRLWRRWDVRPGQQVCEPGCGTGRLTERLAAAVGPCGSVLAIDLSRAMVSRALDRGLPAHVEIRLASVCDIPACGFRFDHAICLNAFPHFEDRPRAVAEMARVLRPGGSLWIAHLACRREVNAFHAEAGNEVRDHVIPTEEVMRAAMGAAGLVVAGFSDGDDSYLLHAVRPGTARTPAGLPPQ